MNQAEQGLAVSLDGNALRIMQVLAASLQQYAPE
jgi:hypothetical protein